LLILSFILGLGGLLGMIFGASVAGSEWSWGTLKNAVSRGESRWRYMVSTFVGVVILLGVALVITYAAGILSALGAGQLAGITTSGLDDQRVLEQLPEQLGRTWLSLAEQAAIGFAIATLARSQLAGIGVGIGLYFGEQFASIFLPDQVRYLPFHVAERVVDLAVVVTGAPGVVSEGVTPDQAVLLATAWMVGAIALAALFTDRADITG
jgi:ABC-type transport system involved in multi-copper enzyme maturation permease subunit